MKILSEVHSKTDNVTKYIIDAGYAFGLNEVSIIRKDNKDVICLPTQTNCNLGCKFCHLTGTTRPVWNINTEWFIDVIQYFIGLTDQPVLVSFMGAGEPLLNMESILQVVDYFERLYHIRFALATTLPNKVLADKFLRLVDEFSRTIKVHVSLHGFDSRKELIPSSKMTGTACVRWAEKYLRVTGNDIEYHYTLVEGINDINSELQKHFYS